MTSPSPKPNPLSNESDPRQHQPDISLMDTSHDAIQVRTSTQEPVSHQFKANDKAAAGLSAVVSSLKEIHKHTGIIAGSRLLAQMNQQGGFDCPGCAWPDPAHRSAPTLHALPVRTRRHPPNPGCARCNFGAAARRRPTRPLPHLRRRRAL